MGTFKRIVGIGIVVAAGVVVAVASTQVSGAANTPKTTNIYWSNYGSNTIGSASLAGAIVNESFISGVSAPVGITVYKNYIYWANSGSDTIGRASLNGTGVIQNFVTVQGVPHGVAVHGKYIYWTERYGNAIGRERSTELA